MMYSYYGIGRVLFTGGGEASPPKHPASPTKEKRKKRKKRERGKGRERKREGEEEIRERILFG
jgi:hypothetical protein